jgi:hypothetical protein
LPLLLDNHNRKALFRSFLSLSLLFLYSIQLIKSYVCFLFKEYNVKGFLCFFLLFMGLLVSFFTGLSCLWTYFHSFLLLSVGCWWFRFLGLVIRFLDPNACKSSFSRPSCLQIFIF